MANLDILEDSIDKFFHEDSEIEQYITKRQEVKKVIENAGKLVSEAEMDAFEIHILKPFGNDIRVYRAFRFYLGHPKESEYFDAEKITERIIWYFIEEFEYFSRKKKGHAVFFEYDYYTADNFNDVFNPFFHNLYDDKEAVEDENFRIFTIRFTPSKI